MYIVSILKSIIIYSVPFVKSLSIYIITTIASGASVPSYIFTPFKDLSKFFIILAMAAIGLNTNIIKLVKKGGKSIFTGFCCWIRITTVSLLLQHFLGIW